jgi:hypothetical protein
LRVGSIPAFSHHVASEVKCGVRRCAEKASQDSGSKYSAQT